MNETNTTVPQNPKYECSLSLELWFTLVLTKSTNVMIKANKKEESINTLHYQDELDNQPKSRSNQVRVHIAHQKLFQPQK